MSRTPRPLGRACSRGRFPWPVRRALAGFWLGPSGGRGVSVVVFDDEEAANAVAARFRVGEPPMPDAPAGVTVKTVEVREVLAAL